MSRQAPRQIAQVIGGNIKAARNRKGLTQHELALAMGTEGFQVSRWERGLHRPEDERLMALSEILGVSIGEFYEPPEEAAA